jgi:hypothetical protein
MKDHFYGKEGFNIVEADVSNYQQLLKVIGSKIDIAFYHSIECSTKSWKEICTKR